MNVFNMNDEKLIECVRMHPVLYDLSNVKYMDTHLKNELWREIGEEMEVDGATCKTRWNNIRDTYRKSLKKCGTKNGQGARKIKTYKYSKHLSFLKNFFEDRECITNIESQGVEEHEETMISREESDDEQSPTPDQGKEHRNLGSAKFTKKRRIREAENHPTSESALMEYIISKNENQTPLQPQHPVDAFLASIALTLKTFSPYHLHLSKAEIFNTVQKYELKTIMGDNST